MPVLRATMIVEAPVHTVVAAVRDVEVVRASAADAGHDVRTAAAGLLVPGDELRFDVRVLPALRVAVHVRMCQATVDSVESELVAGPPLRLRHTTVLTGTGAGTLVTDTLDWLTPLGPLGRVADVVVLRALVLDALRARTQCIRRRAEELAVAPVVVGAAIVEGNRVLAAQRSYPREADGRWELPGGRVERGETEHQALVRECREELGTSVVPGERIGPDVPLPRGLVLRVHAAHLADPAAAPRAREHRALRWASADDLAELDWLDTDRALLPDLGAHLRNART